MAQLKLSLDPRSSCSQRCCPLEVSLSRLRIGYTRLTHDHLMAREAPPVCDRYQVRLSVFYVLVECSAYVPRNLVFLTLTSFSPRERLFFLLSESPTFSSSTLFAYLRVSGLSHPEWNEGDRSTDVEENSRGRNRQRLVEQARPRAYSRYIHVKQE